MLQTVPCNKSSHIYHFPYFRSFVCRQISSHTPKSVSYTVSVSQKFEADRHVLFLSVFLHWSSSIQYNLSHTLTLRARNLVHCPAMLGLLWVKHKVKPEETNNRPSYSDIKRTSERQLCILAWCYIWLPSLFLTINTYSISLGRMFCYSINQ